MADQNKIVYNINVNAEQGTATIRDLKGQIVATQVPVDQLRGKFGNFAKQVNAVEFKKFNKGLKSATSSNAELTRASGGATTSVLELGRVVSDAPYGIRGMANNVSQLASNMLFTAQQVDKTTGKVKGFGGVLKDMGKAFMGPLGVLFLIQGAIALLDGFFGASKKAENATQDFSASISDNASKLLILNQVLQSSSTSMSDKKEIINDVNSEFKNLNLSLDENGSLTDASRIALDKLTNSMVKNAKAQAIMKKITDEQSTIVDIEIEQAAKIREAAAENTLGVGVFEGTLDGLIKKQNEYIERYQRQIDYNNLTEQKKKDAMESYMNTTTMQRFENLKNFRKDDLKDAEKNIADMVALLTGTDLDTFAYTPKDDKEKKLSPFKTPKELDIDIKNVENAIIQYEKKIEDARLKKELNDKLSEAKSEEERRKIREKYKEDKLRNQIDAERKALKLKMNTEKAVVNQKVDDHIDDLKRATELYIHKTKLDKKLSSEQKKQMIGIAESQLQIATNQAQKEGMDSVKEITENYKPLFVLFEQLGKARMESLFSGFGTKKTKQQEILEKQMFYAEQFMMVQQSLTDFLGGEFDRQLTMEQNKTNAINNELNKRLLNENLSKDERKRIQLQIGANDEKLRIKQEQIERKRFKLNKAANMSQAIITTYLNATKAYASQLSLPTPDAPIRAKVAYGTAMASGLLSVAGIARQKFQSSAGSGGQIGGGFGGGGSGGADRSFNFNLAGASQENQLAQALQGQFDRPIQTYVVSRDITNRQQLDLDIENNASFG